jgi:phage shock protein A
LVSGIFSSWLKDRENDRPRIVYEQAIGERIRQYAQLKQAVAGILYMRNKLEGEVRERRADLARAQQLIRRAVERGDDDVALQMIEQKDLVMAEMERDQKELTEIEGEVEQAKANLVKFRGEIRTLEREKVRIMAQLANAKARRRIQEAIDGLSVEGDMKALESVREHVAQLRAEGNIDRELGDPVMQSRVRAIRDEVRSEAARRELIEIKRRMRPDLLPRERDGVIEVAPN